MADHHNTNNGDRDWSSLPSDAVATIADHLLPLPDHLRFRSVCKSWSNAVPPLAMPSPLLLLPSNAADSLTFCSIASPETTFDSPVPPGVAGAHIVGSHDGWLALSDLALNVFLFNPFTADRIDLPPFTTNPGLKFIYRRADGGSAATVRVSYLYREPVSTVERSLCYILKIVFNSSPTAQNLMAVAINMTGGVVYARAGDDKWSSFVRDDDLDEDSEFSCSDYCVHDVLFHDGRFWAIHRDGKLLALDLRGEGLPEVSLVFDMFGIHSLRGFCKDVGLSKDDSVLYGDMYLAVGDDGGIVVVFIDKGEDGEGFHGSSLVVIKFVGPEFDRVRRVRKLWGQSLFVGYNNGFSLPARRGHRLRGNCVFVTDFLCDTRHNEYDLGVFYMGNKRFELMFPRCTEFKWCQPPPVIFLPSMIRNNLESTLVS